MLLAIRRRGNPAELDFVHLVGDSTRGHEITAGICSEWHSSRANGKKAGKSSIVEKERQGSGDFIA
jgi:hypothetical protein